MHNFLSRGSEFMMNFTLMFIFEFNLEQINPEIKIVEVGHNQRDHGSFM